MATGWRWPVTLAAGENGLTPFSNRPKGKRKQIKLYETGCNDGFHLLSGATNDWRLFKLLMDAQLFWWPRKRWTTKNRDSGVQLIKNVSASTSKDPVRFFYWSALEIIQISFTSSIDFKEFCLFSIAFFLVSNGDSRFITHPSDLMTAHLHTKIVRRRLTPKL